MLLFPFFPLGTAGNWRFRFSHSDVLYCIMAATSSDGSSVAPTDFHLTSSIDESATRISSNYLKCPMCNSSRRTFYCKQCIQNGDFVHSTPHYVER